MSTTAIFTVKVVNASQGWGKIIGPSPYIGMGEELKHPRLCYYRDNDVLLIAAIVTPTAIHWYEEYVVGSSPKSFWQRVVSNIKNYLKR